jgi:hypothetical protein
MKTLLFVREASRNCARVHARRILLLVYLVVAAGSRLAAADQAASIAVSVTDEKHQPVAEATVDLHRDAEAVRSALTNSAGQVFLKAPGPGDFVLVVSKKGYFPAETPLTVKSDTPAAEIEVTLTQVELSQQDVTVQGTSSNPVAEQSSTPAVLTPTQATQTPSRPATVTEALPLIPGVVRASNGTVGIAGYSENHSTLLVNSVDVTDPATGDFGLSVPIDSVETISVSEMPYLAEYGRFIAGVVAAETRRGGEKWTYSLNDPLPEFRIRSGHLVGLKTASPRFNVSGPLIPNRLYVSEGAEYLLYKQAVRTLPFPENETRSEAINTFTQLDAIISPKQTLTASVHLAPHSFDYAGLDYFNPRPVTPNADFHELTTTVIDRWSVGGGLLQSTLALTGVSNSVEAQGSADMVVTPSGNRGNYFSQQSRQATRFEWIENWAPRTFHFHGDHALQIGTVLSYSEDEGRFHARPVQIQDANGHPIQKIDFTGGQPFVISDREPALYVQDHWILNSRFALDFGTRVEAQTITYTTRTAPRGGFVWSPDRDRKTVIRGGVGVFYDSVPLSTYAFRNYPEQVITSYDASGAVVGSPIHYVNIMQQKTESGLPFVNREQQSGNFAPYSLAWNLGLERSINRALIVRVKYLQSQAHDIITLEPQSVLDLGAMVLGSSGAARTRQYEITARIGADPKRQFFFSYVRQQARGDLSDGSSYLGNYPFPVIRGSIHAALPEEIPDRFLLWGTYALPRKMQLNPHIEYRNGFPYQPTDVLQQYVPLGVGPQPRFPRYFVLDMLVSKDFQISKKHAVRFSVPLMNITNHFNPLQVHSNIADPNYGRFFGNYPRRILLDFDILN